MKKNKKFSNHNEKKIKKDLPNKETLEAIEEGRRLALDPNVPSYDNIEDLKKALEVWNNRRAKC